MGPGAAEAALSGEADGVGAIRGDKEGRGATGGAAARASAAAAVERARKLRERQRELQRQRSGKERKLELEVIVGGPRRRNARENATKRSDEVLA